MIRRPTDDGSAAAPEAADAPADAMIEATDLVRDDPSGDSVIHTLRGIDLRVGRRELVAVGGRSGSGRMTLLDLLAGLGV